MRRLKRVSRYAHITWAYRERKKLQKLPSREIEKILDGHLAHLLDYYSAIRVAELMRILIRTLDISPLRIKNFDRFHRRCGHILVEYDVNNKINENGRDFFLFAKNKMEHITRVRINRPDMPSLIREYLNTTVGYSPMSNEEYAELQRAIAEHLRELKFNPTASEISFTMRAWRLNNVLDRVYGVDLPE